MDSIFSHADPTPGSEATGAPDRIDPVVVSVTVPRECDQAYEGFVDYLHLWWPLGTLSAIGPGSHLGIEGAALIEESDAGERRQWASVLRAEPPLPVEAQNLAHGVVELEFTLGHEQEAPTRVSIDFRETGTGATDVTVTHDGWAAGDVGSQQRARAGAWPEILGYYQRFMGGAA